MRRRTFISGCILPLASAAEISADGPEALLASVAATYQSIIDYSFRVKSIVEEGDQKDGGHYHLAASLPRQLFCEQQTRENKPIRFATDGVSAWAYSPSRRQYSLAGAVGSEALTHLKAVHGRFFGRFTLLDRVRVELQELKGGTAGGKRCRRIRISPAAATKEDWTEILWIDPASALVMKSVHRRIVRVPYRTETKTTAAWEQYRIGRKPESHLFVFHVPPDASRTNSLSAPMP